LLEEARSKYILTMDLRPFVVAGGFPVREFTEDEEELLNAGFALLLDNVDIVDWLVCMLPRPQQIDGPCLVDMISNGGFGYAHGAGLPTDGGVAGVFPDLDGTLIITMPKFDSEYVSNWLTFPSEENRFCVAMLWAAVTLHELFHMCGGSTPAQNDQAGECHASYMIMNSFLSMMLQRYPCMRDAPCCKGIIEFGDPWMWDGALGRSCV